MNTPIRPIVTRPPVVRPIVTRPPSPAELRLKTIMAHQRKWGHVTTVCEAVGVYPA